MEDLLLNINESNPFEVTVAVIFIVYFWLVLEISNKKDK